jgi:hypothetical protein
VVGGREVVSYTNAKPAKGTRYEIVVRRQSISMPVTPVDDSGTPAPGTP